MTGVNISETMTNTLDFSQYNKETLDRLVELDKQIKEEESKEKKDKNKIVKLRMAQLMRGLELNYGKDWVFG